MQPQCTAVDIRDSDPTPIDVAFEFVVDATRCPDPEHLRIVRCKLAPF